MTTLRSLAYARGVVMPASPLGKIRMVAQVVAILALILAHGEMHQFLLIGQAALSVVVITAQVSAVPARSRMTFGPPSRRRRVASPVVSPWRTIPLA